MLRANAKSNYYHQSKLSVALLNSIPSQPTSDLNYATAWGGKNITLVLSLSVLLFGVDDVLNDETMKKCI